MPTPLHTRLDVQREVARRAGCSVYDAHFAIRTESGYYPPTSPSEPLDPRIAEVGRQVEREMGWTHEPVPPADAAEAEARARAWLFAGSRSGPF